MATKNISRSAVEGGRRNSNKYDRRQSHRIERQDFRAWRHQVAEDLDYLEQQPVKKRPWVPKDFTDNLNPAFRWIASRCNRPWAEVYSELSSKFDTRKLSCWHVVYQHMLPEIEGGKKVENNFGIYHLARFVVDDDGVLRDRGERYGWYKKSKRREGPTFSQVENRIGKRRVCDVDGVLFWMVEDGFRWVPCESYYGRYRCWRKKHRKANNINAFEHRYARDEHEVTAYKRWRKLNENEIRWWDSIRKSIRERFTY